MSQDPLERVQLFLSETKVDPLALLLEPTGDGALLHGEAQHWHGDGGGHAPRAYRRR